MVMEEGKEEHRGVRPEGAHLNGRGELDLVEDKCDKVPTAHTPTGHQLPTNI